MTLFSLETFIKVDYQDLRNFRIRLFETFTNEIVFEGSMDLTQEVNMIASMISIVKEITIEYKKSSLQGILFLQMFIVPTCFEVSHLLFIPNFMQSCYSELKGIDKLSTDYHQYVKLIYK